MDVQQYNVTKAAADSENPTGDWVGAPDTADSTVAMKNTSGFTLWVQIAGGTVTEIDVNGIDTSLISGSFRLLPGDRIAITYSDKPNVGWTFDSPVSVVPVGAWADAPDLADSGADMFNTSGFPVMVYVSGGTVTEIDVDDVVTGLTSGSFHLRRGSKINLTHSEDPTLVWVYE